MVSKSTLTVIGISESPRDDALAAPDHHTSRSEMHCPALTFTNCQITGPFPWPSLRSASDDAGDWGDTPAGQGVDDPSREDHRLSRPNGLRGKAWGGGFGSCRKGEG